MIYYDTARQKMWIRNARKSGFRRLKHRRCNRNRCPNWLRSKIYRWCKKCRDNQRAFKWRHRIVPAHQREFVVETDQIITLRMKSVLAEEVYLRLANKRIDRAGQRCEYCGIRPHALYRVQLAKGWRTLCNGHAEALRRALRTRAQRRLTKNLSCTREEFEKMARKHELLAQREFGAPDPDYAEAVAYFKERMRSSVDPRLAAAPRRLSYGDLQLLEAQGF